MKRITIFGIAEKANTSSATESWVLSKAQGTTEIRDGQIFLQYVAGSRKRWPNQCEGNCFATEIN